MNPTAAEPLTSGDPNGDPQVLPLPNLPRSGRPTWEIACLYPNQGEWTEEDYLALDANTNRMIELSDGCLEFLPMPGLIHQFIARYVFEMLVNFVREHGLGEVLFSPLPVRLWQGKIREPDIMFFRPHRIKNRRKPPDGADLAMEITSEGKDARERDLETKRAEYAKAGIQEYWIIDPELRQITVLVLDGQVYREHGVFGPGTIASSVHLNGFSLSVDAVFAAGEGESSK